MYNLIISEKPSQGKTYAAALGANSRKDGYLEGNGFIVSWCFGHLLELAPPDAYDKKYAKWRYEDLPIVPEKWKHITTKDKAARLKTLKELMNRVDVDCIINACDAGREGELIFRLVYEYAKCKKPTKRLWISSMEDSAIKTGFANLKDGVEYDNLYHAAACREQADWTVGISATRAFSILYNQTLSVGRVQSPTLAMLVKREAEIDNFVKTPFYTVELDGEITAASERFSDKEEAENIAANCNTATVKSVVKTEKSIAPPKLYDLTTLQREANRVHGFTAAQTLEYLQSLYEQKLTTYPRVDSRYLTDDMAGTVAGIVSLISPDAPCDVSQVIDNSKVSDHSAIIPTTEIVNVIIDALPTGERAILDMIKNRLICAVGEKHRYLETVVILDCNGTEFKSKGKTVLHNGWKNYAVVSTDEADESNTSSLNAEVAEGQIFPVSAKLKEGFTSPPKSYTEDTILAAMDVAGAENEMLVTERRGIGTPSTRAAILEKLVKSGFVERSKKNLLPTEKAKSLIAVLPTALTSAKLTAEWENKLKQVERGKLSTAEFMDEITQFITAIVRENNAPKPEFSALFTSVPTDAPAPLGVCPRCGSPVREGAKGYFCDSRSCEFKLWKESKFWTVKKQPLTAAIVASLLKEGSVELKNLYSEKTGKTYNATISLDDNGGKYVNYKMSFDKKGAK
ncbi:MAG: DNA topoisomerase 3 [Oscillospiraceae bacterium]|jgi:DNA topoisomerase-3|nr:DNA topoisomerase 3 [Oscillospiraceae bacterium]